jgi:hypothetical protein
MCEVSIMEESIVYFEKRGKENTGKTLEIAKRRALELGINEVVIASTHGYSALQAAQVFSDTDTRITAVSISPTFDDVGWRMTEDERVRVEAAGVTVLTGLHALADGVPEGFYGEHTTGTIVSDTLRFFSQGMKVAVEISIMALEAGIITPKTEVISIGGTDEGVDTAIVAIPAFARKIKEYRVLEILCKPRMA